MKVSLIQSNFIPWVGYLSIIKNSDLFILYEDVQYTKNDWRNRNKFLINNNETWITIPVHYSDKQNFQTVTTKSYKFFEKFKKTIENNYSNNNNYKKIKNDFESKIQICSEEKLLKNINRIFLSFLLDLYNIKTKIIFLEEAPPINNPSEKVLKILKNYSATEYLSGASAKNYLNEELFLKNNIKLNYVNYDNLIKPFLTESNKKYINFSSLQFFLES
jgi:hypothetical protein